MEGYGNEEKIKSWEIWSDGFKWLLRTSSLNIPCSWPWQWWQCSCSSSGSSSSSHSHSQRFLLFSSFSGLWSSSSQSWSQRFSSCFPSWSLSSSFSHSQSQRLEPHTFVTLVFLTCYKREIIFVDKNNNKTPAGRELERNAYLKTIFLLKYNIIEPYLSLLSFVFTFTTRSWSVIWSTSVFFFGKLFIIFFFILFIWDGSFSFRTRVL